MRNGLDFSRLAAAFAALLVFGVVAGYSEGPYSGLAVSNLDMLLQSSRSMCLEGRRIANLNATDPQYIKLRAALDKLDIGSDKHPSLGPLKFEEAKTHASVTLSFGHLCSGNVLGSAQQQQIDPNGQYRIDKEAANKLVSATDGLAGKITDLVKALDASQDLVSAAQNDSARRGQQVLADYIRAAWKSLQQIKQDFRDLSFNFEDDPPPIIYQSNATLPDQASVPKSSAPPDQSKPASQEPPPVSLDNTPATPNSSTPVSPQKPQDQPSLFSRLKNNLVLLFEVVLLAFLAVILFKIRDSRVLQLNETQSRIIESTATKVGDLSTKVTELSQKVQTLTSTMLTIEQEEKKRSDAAEAAALEARRQAESYSPDPPIKHPSPNESVDATKSPAANESSDAGSSEASSNIVGAGSAPQVEASSGDVLLDYNRARAMSNGESWFRKYYTPTRYACENLDSLRGNSAAQVRFVPERRGAFIAVKSNMNRWSAFPDFTLEYDSARKELDGVFAYRDSSDSRSRVSKPAILIENGDHLVLGGPGEIQNG